MSERLVKIIYRALFPYMFSTPNWVELLTEVECGDYSNVVICTRVLQDGGRSPLRIRRVETLCPV